MKKNILRQLIMLSKRLLYAFLIQLFLCTVVLANTGNAQRKTIEDIKVSLNLQDKTLLQFFKQVEFITDFKFTYNNDLVDRRQKVTVVADNLTLYKVLESVSRQAKLNFVQVNENIHVNSQNFNKEQAVEIAQVVDVTVSGIVTDANGEPVPGVTVSVPGTGIGTATDLNGKYTLSVPEGSTLVFSFIGFVAQSIEIGDRSVIDVTLSEDMASLEEVVVVGYGEVQRKDLTGSVGSVNSAEFKDLAVNRVDQALSGRVAGVQVKLADGQPGSAPQIRVRGIGSISASGDPLYVVDGFPTDNIQTLNPNDIESLDILKDASATAIYGSRGSNGVVIITTKRGQTGKPRINLDTYHGFQKISKAPEFLDGMEQANYHYNAIRNRNINANLDVTGDPSTWGIRVPQTVLDVLSGSNTNNTDALDAVLRTAPQRSYNLSFMGGSENIKYSVSGEYFDQDGIIINSNFKRYSVRANIDAQLTERLAIRVDVNPSFTIDNNVIARGGGAGASTSIIGSATSAQPYYPLYNSDDSYFVYQAIDASTDLFNPLALALEKTDFSRRTRLMGNANIEYKIIDGLKINVMLGATTNNSKGSTFTPQLPVFHNRAAIGTDFAGLGYNWLAEYTANYSKIFGKHNLAALAGYTVQKDVFESNFMQSNNYPNNLVPWISAVSGIITTGTASKEEWSIVSQLARVNYNFDGKYFLTASIRRDGSSRFGGNNKYGFFPSIAAAWRISDERFMPQTTLIDMLKFRVSYGKTGNNNIGNYASLATINYVKYATGGVAQGGFAPGAFANPNLTWETQEQINAGIDLGLFSGRVNIIVDHFRSSNKDLLLNVNVPTSSGFNTALQNIGEVKNTGWEFVLSSINIDKRFRWSTDFNLSAYTNEVVKLGPSGDDIISGNNITRIGQPIGMFYGFIVDGIFKNSSELSAGPIYNPGLGDASTVGDIRFKDVSGPEGTPDGIIDNNDLTIIGSPYPDFYFGMTNSLSFQNLSLSFNIAGSQGNQIYSNAFVIYKLTRSRSRTLATERNYWKSETDPGDGVTPKPDDNPRGGLRRPSTRYLDEGSYIRVNNITLSYLVPNSVSERLSVGSIRFYVNATNPFIFTKNLSFNPDVSDSGNPLQPGRDSNNYPLPKSIILGLNLSF